MSERPDPADGLGRSSAGTPAFSAPTFLPPPAAAAPRALARPAPPGPARPSRWPTVVATAVVLLVVGVTVVATLVARHADTRVAAPPVRSRPAADPPSAGTAPDRIDFTAARGTGRLVVRERRWETGNPARLRVSVELLCTTGTVDHGPGSFQLFEADGTPVPPALDGGGPGGIGFGTLGPGERVRGDVVFEVARQAVTLVLHDDDGSVTALRIAD